MKETIKYIGIFFLIIFSFYYTDKISTLIIYKSDLMQEILNNKKLQEAPFINAQIKGEFIVPGINGLSVNELDSYYQMKKEYLYSEDKLIFNEVEPSTSLENNKHLIINKGNENKNSVSIIIDNNSNVISYCEQNSLNIDILIIYDSFSKDSKFEQINNDKDFNKLDIILNKYNLNTNICIVNSQNKEYCLKNKKYLVTPTYNIDDSKIVGLEITSGDIIYINKDLSLANFKLLLKKINYRDLKIIRLSELISEKRNNN